MKKLKNYIILLLTILVITGCSNNKKPENIIKIVEGKLKNAENYNLEYYELRKIDQETINYEYSVIYKYKVDRKNKAAYGTSQIIADEVEGYLDLSSSEPVSYTKTNLGWEKTLIGKMAIKDADKFSYYLGKYKSIEKGKDTNDSLYYYILTIDNEKFFQEMFKDSGGLDETEIERLKTKTDVKINYYINKKDNTLNRIYIDLTEFIDAITAVNNENPYTIYTMEIKYNNFNELEDISIPQNITEEANNRVDSE